MNTRAPLLPWGWVETKEDLWGSLRQHLYSTSSEAVPKMQASDHVYVFAAKYHSTLLIRVLLPPILCSLVKEEEGGEGTRTIPQQAPAMFTWNREYLFLPRKKTSF